MAMPLSCAQAPSAQRPVLQPERARQTAWRGERDVTLHPPLLAFAQHWSYRPIACAQYRAQTKSKDERGVGYVQNNAHAGHTCDSCAAREARLCE